MSDNGASTEPISEQRGASRRLTEDEKQRIVQRLLVKYNNGKLQHGVVNEVAKDFNISRKTISKIWNQAKKSVDEGMEKDVKIKRVGRVGRKRLIYDLSKLKDIPLRRRTNIRALAKGLGMSKSTVHRLVQSGEIRSHSNAIKPLLTEDNINKRLAFCLDSLVPHTIHTTPKFQEFYDYIHIDEKWFFMSKTTQKYYLHPEENEPIRTCKSKRFIPKVMFLAAVARPMFGENNEVLFDGKIGIFPFVFMERAKRYSKKRDAGSLEMKPILSVTKDVMKLCLLNKVLPAIKAKWPQGRSKRIFIQQDNARPHISPVDTDFVQAAQQDGWDIQLTYQPPNSPNLNVLDLGFFRYLQSAQYQHAPKNIVELVQVVENEFENHEANILNNVWLSLQYCMAEIIKFKGSNAYKPPHVGKALHSTRQ